MIGGNDSALLWSRWQSRAKLGPSHRFQSCAGAGTERARVSLHALNRDCLRRVLALLPCKERYFLVCKLFRLELLAIATSARRLQGPRVHHAHACPTIRDVPHPNHCGAACSLGDGDASTAWAPLQLASGLRTLEDGLAHFAAGGWPAVLSDAAARTRLETLVMSFVPWSACAASHFGPLLSACARLTQLVLDTDTYAVAATLAELPRLRQLRSFTLRYSGPASVELAMLSTLPALESLTVTGRKVGPYCVAAALWLEGDQIWETARQCNRLTALTLSASWKNKIHAPQGPWFPPPSRPPIAAPLASVTINFTHRRVVARPERFYVLQPLLFDLAELTALTQVCLSSSNQRDYGALRNARQPRRDGALVVHAPPTLTTELAALPSWPLLQTLALGCQPRLGEALPPENDVLPEQLRRLSVCADDPWGQHYLRRLGQCASLTHVVVDCHVSEPLRAADLALFTAWCRTGPTLESLTLNCRVTEPSALRALHHLTALTELRVDVAGCVGLDLLAEKLTSRLVALGVLGLTEASARPLLRVLPAMRHLTALDLSRCEHGVLHGVAGVLPHAPALRVLELRDVQPNAPRPGRRICSPWLALAAALPACPGLKVVRIGRLDHAPWDGGWVSGGHLHRMVTGALEGAFLRCPGLLEAELAELTGLADLPEPLDLLSPAAAASGRSAQRVALSVVTWKSCCVLAALWTGYGVGVHFGMPFAVELVYFLAGFMGSAITFAVIVALWAQRLEPSRAAVGNRLSLAALDLR